MSLLFTASSTNKVELAALPVTNAQAMTAWAWVYPTSFANGLGIYQQDVAGAGFRVLSVRSTGAVRLEVDRLTTDLLRESSNTLLAANTWYFVAATYNIATPESHLYIGTLSAALVEPTYTAGSTNGAGATITDALGGARWGNRGTASALAFGGRLATVGLLNRLLTQGELQTLQFRPRPVVGQLLFQHLGFNGTGTQADWSGNANNGTVTGTAVANHAPLGPPFGYDAEWSGAFTAAAAADTLFAGSIM